MSYPAPDASAERARQWRVRNKVRTHGGRSLFAFVFSFLTVLAAGQTVYSVSTYTISQGWPAVPVLAVSLVLLIAPLAVLWFAWRTLQLSGEAGKSADVYRGRELGAQASDLSWQVISYAVAVLIICAGAWFMIVNDAAVSRTFFDVSLIVKSAGTVLKAFGTNIVIFFVSAILILVWALVIAVARTLPGKAGKPIRVLATLYSDLFRGLPAIITIYLIGFGLPLTGLPIVKDLSSNAYAIIALTLTYGAYTSEVYRAGIESVHPSQIAAARSLGLSYVRTMRYVVIAACRAWHHSAADEQLHQPAEGHRTRRHHWHHRRLQPVEDHRRELLQPVGCHHCRHSVHRHHHSAGPFRGPPDRT